MDDVRSLERRQVRVWFGKHLIAEFRAGVRWAERYARILRLRFAGIRVTVVPAYPTGPKHRASRNRQAVPRP